MSSGGLIKRSALSLSSWFCVPEQVLRLSSVQQRAEMRLV
jgi:hypothetical protein